LNEFLTQTLTVFFSLSGREFHILGPWYLILKIPKLVLVFGKEYVATMYFVYWDNKSLKTDGNLW
jgi:hypothetical protein